MFTPISVLQWTKINIYIFDLDLCDLDLQLYRKQWNLAHNNGILSFSSAKYMINVYMTGYANVAYFDLELHDLDLDPRSNDISHILFLSMPCYIKKEQTQYLS